ncbi:zf-CGNR multi-domain protein [Streptomyces armeniacus]|uniref:Zf-CGNR multi-domain protein n=1 Tax=Streptomyces armeniacus TaxID=83291 RepID=A0A345XTZ8_9ACTN|nr:CGNR zinc finger domain-containing protein [Streptomyces armeniacus]AXK35114.1 zf-CGNR multi-domain protein [Streptomyces armeniacus]
MDYAFVSGNAALDLAGTLQWRRTAPRDRLAGPADLRRWIDEAGLLPGGPADVDTGGFARALELREAVHRLAQDRLEGRRFDRGALDVVNRIAATPGRRVVLTDAGAEVRGDTAAVLADVAAAAIELLADRDLVLKECGRESCTRLYVDRSQGARRTWCGMEECGNRVKAAAYRARRRRGGRT